MHPLLFLENHYVPEHVMYTLFVFVILALLSVIGHETFGSLSRQDPKCDGSDYWRI